MLSDEKTSKFIPSFFIFEKKILQTGGLVGMNSAASLLSDNGPSVV